MTLTENMSLKGQLIGPRAIERVSKEFATHVGKEGVSHSELIGQCKCPASGTAGHRKEANECVAIDMSAVAP
jgi:hypothetical protein